MNDDPQGSLRRGLYEVQRGTGRHASRDPRTENLTAKAG